MLSEEHDCVRYRQHAANDNMSQFLDENEVKKIMVSILKRKNRLFNTIILFNIYF